ncbi:hypothetical protein Pmani_011149 [Petrolisthes manimaculis]|uniref:DNA-binding protein SMUBP-2 n=1 Tax=Petrolisthes manimaculis TaxID=1843537 RepID=A0AAE1UGH9_9EUCA|nr:hypothetical protein Pmani_011149 [Petrolisthes manimaculis]
MEGTNATSVPNMTRLSRHDWVSLHTALLEQERKAEVEAAQAQLEGVPLKSLESRGIVVSGLVVGERSTGLYGRPTITFTTARKDTPLPANTLTPGDIVGVREGKTGHGMQLTTGVIIHTSQSSVRLAIDDGADEMDGLDDNVVFQLHKLTSNVTYRRIKAGLEMLEKGESGPASHLVSLLFGECPPKQSLPSLPPQLIQASGKLQLLNHNLDESQEEAVKFALQRSDLAVIHGPPGTGKTTTIVEIIKQHVKLKAKVLACAPSNLAVDNIVERLAVGRERTGEGIRIVRIGHPARATSLTQQYTLDALVHRSEEAGILDDIRRDIQEHLGLLKKARDKGRRYHIRTEIKTLRKELRERETRLVRQVLLGADVILSTLTSTGQDGPLRHLPEHHVSLAVIDECSQAIEASCYGALLRAPKVILAGDHCQLPPTIVSSEAASRGLSHSLMERVINEQGEEVVKMLTMQYRMHQNIMNWASSVMYHSRLTAHPSVASHLLSHLPGVEKIEDTETPMVLVDTTGCGCEELDTQEDQSKGNKGEAVLAAGRVAALVEAGVPQAAVAVVTPYNLQVELIRGLLREQYPGVEVRSVDGFQGREKEAIILSLVRSNKQGTVGFLSEDRRLNVAVTRARRHLTVVCDSSTVSQHQFICNLLDHITQHGIVRSAHQYQEELDTTEVFIPEGIVWKSKESEKGKQKPDGKKRVKDSGKDKKNNKSQHEARAKTEEDNQRRRKEFFGIINKFLMSQNQTHEFSSNLNSYERCLVHEICEELGLEHESQGEGKERRIVVKKKQIGEKLEDEKKNENDDAIMNCLEGEEEFSSEKKDLEEEIQRFVNSGKQVHAFSSRLSAYQRNLVHMLCDEQGLMHESQGEGKKRHVVVRKTHNRSLHNIAELGDENKMDEVNEKQCENLCLQGKVPSSSFNKECRNKEKKALNSLKHSERILKESTNNKQKITISAHKSLETSHSSDPQEGSTTKIPALNESSANQSKSQHGAVPKLRTRFVGGCYEEVKLDDTVPQTKRCGVCRKDVPVMNWSVHTAQCERHRDRGGQGRNRDKYQVVNEAKQKTRKKNTKKEKRDKGKEEKEEDFDSIISHFTKENNTCSHPPCSTSTTVIAQLCPFCRRTFCLAHHIPEIHGCGDAARHEARKVIARDGVLYPGSGVPSKKPNETQRRRLERRLEKRMEELSGQRKPKQAEKDKGNEKGKK